MRAVLPILLLIGLHSGPAMANDEADAIEHLLVAVGSSNCTFIRNGKEYPSADAEDHLRMKYRRGKKWAPDAEAFIKRLASKSSFSGKPYRIRCSDEPAQLTADWLSARLADYAFPKK